MNGNIVLCGFMGSGKTCIGKRTAKLMGREFLDLDKYVEEKEGMSITEIFAAFGEEGFREREATAVKEIAAKEGTVVACGGGTVLFERNVEAFRSAGDIIILLSVPVEVLQKRLRFDKTRPLLQKPNRNEIIRKLYNERIPLYRAAADISIRATAPPQVLAGRIEAMVKMLEGDGPKAE